MKKMICVLLALGMIGGLFSGCKKKNDSIQESTTESTAVTQTSANETMQEETSTLVTTEVTEASESIEVSVTEEPTTEAITEPPETTCGHIYTEATCFAPKTCTKCGLTEGGAMGHTTTHGICGRCQGVLMDFNNTYWDLGVGQTLGSHYIFKACTDGTFLAYNFGSGTFTNGTYYTVGGELYISIDWLNDIPFAFDDDGFISTKQYEMMVGQDYYNIDPADESGRNIFDEAYQEMLKYERSVEILLKTVQPLVEIVYNVGDKHLEEAEVIYGEEKLLVYEPSIQEYRFENTDIPFEVYYRGTIEAVIMHIADMHLETDRINELRDAVSVIASRSYNSRISFAATTAAGETIEINVIGFKDGCPMEEVYFFWGS